jgi:hypothetical protein
MFPLKENERFYQNYLQRTTNEFKVAVARIKTFFEDGGYKTKNNIGCLKKGKSGQRRIYAVSNLLARRKGVKEIASVVYFPRNKTVTTSMVIKRLERLSNCFAQVAVFLCGEKAVFPYISDRIHSRLPDCQIYLYSLGTGDNYSIKTTFKQEVKNDAIKIQSNNQQTTS